MASLNLQQQPKTKGYLQCFSARPGHKIVQLDFEALEPKVLAYYSRDKNLLKLYGPSAKQNDVYLFNAAKMPGLGERILSTGYNPDNPTPEAISKAKKECKSERYTSKIFTLSSQYGAGPEKIYSILRQNGVDISLATCKLYHSNYWEIYSDVKRFEARLLRMYYDNNGWFYGAFGYPISIENTKSKLKDILNRFTQRSGHDILMLFIALLTEEAKDLKWRPWLIDFHDETMLECPEEEVPYIVQAMERAKEKLNEMLGWDIKMTGKIEVVDNLAQIKVEE